MDYISPNIQELKLDQKVWYAELLITTILADEIIHPSELKYIKGIIAHIEDEGERNRLILKLKNREKPELQQPVKVKEKVLAEVFIELIEICTSDLELAHQEEKLLKTVSDLFNFTDHYFNQLMAWCMELLEWKITQKELAFKRINQNDLIVPLERLNTEQKKWYIDVMVSTLMVAGIRDQREKKLLKIMVSSASNKQEQLILSQHVLQRHRPPMKRPPKLPQEIMNQIFVEIILIFISYGSMSYLEQQHIKQLSDVCRMPTQIFTRILDWGQMGIQLVKERDKLMGHVKTNVTEEDEFAASKGLLVQHPDNNAVQIRKLECFVCESKQQINSFQLKPKSQKPTYNIFGVRTYLKNNEGYDFLDFNNIAVTICPSCFFSSTKKEMFKRTPKEEAPLELSDPRFKEQWLAGTAARQEMFGKKLGEIETIHRSASTTVASYKIAIGLSDALAERNRDESYKILQVNQMLMLSQVLMSMGDEKAADENLIDTTKIAEDLFETADDYKQVFRLARLGMLVSLYFDNKEKTMFFYDFFIHFKKEQYFSLEAKDKEEFNKVMGEVKNVLDRKELYVKKALNGYSLDRKKQKSELTI